MSMECSHAFTNFGPIQIPANESKLPGKAASSPPGSWSGRICTIIREGLQWLIQKIVLFIKTLFGTRPKAKKPSTLVLPACSKIRRRSFSELSKTYDTKAILEEIKITSANKKGTSGLIPLSEGKKFFSSPETFKELLGDLESEAAALELSVRSLAINEVSCPEKAHVGMVLDFLRYLQTLNFESLKP